MLKIICFVLFLSDTFIITLKLVYKHKALDLLITISKKNIIISRHDNLRNSDVMEKKLVKEHYSMYGVLKRK
jgi:hypothetical protein